jgi:hypothetical protein
MRLKKTCNMQKTRPGTNYHGSNPFKTQTMRIQPQLLLLLLLLIPKTKNKNKNQESAESKCQKTPRFSSRLGVERGGTGEKGDGGEGNQAKHKIQNSTR